MTVRKGGRRTQRIPFVSVFQSIPWNITYTSCRKYRLVIKEVLSLIRRYEADRMVSLFRPANGTLFCVTMKLEADF